MKDTTGVLHDAPSLTLSTKTGQLQVIVDQMPENEKERLAAYLDRQTIVKRIERFQASARRGLFLERRRDSS